MPQRILAVEFVGERVRGATADRTWNSFEFIGVFETHRGVDEPDLVPALTRLVEKTGRPDILVSALPAESVAKRLLELPFTDSRRLHQVVPFALEEHLPFAEDGSVVTFTRVGRQGDSSLVVAAYVRKQDLQSHLELLARAGLDPKTVTLAPLALAAMFARARNGRPRGSHFLVEADPSTTSMVLLDKSGIPRAIRTVGVGLLAVDGNPVAANEAAPVVNSLRQTLLAHASELDGTDLVVTGAAATVPAVKSVLAEALSLTVRDAGDFDCSALFQGAHPDTSRFASPVAMLLGELPARPVEMLDFRQGEFAFKGRTRGDLTPFYFSGILAACLVGLVFLHFVLGVAVKLHRLSVLNTAAATVAAPALGKDASDPVKQLKSGISEMNRRLRLLGGDVGHHSPLDVLMAVSEALPERIPAEVEDLQIDGTGLRISGEADSFATVDQVKKALDQSDEFGQIVVTHAKAGSEANKVEFRLSADFKDVEGKTD